MNSDVQNLTFTDTIYHVKKGGQGAVLEIGDLDLWYGAAQALYKVTMPIEKGLVAFPGA